MSTVDDAKVKSVLKLLKACRKLGVAELKVSDIHIVLDETARPHHPNPIYPAKIDEVKAKQLQEEFSLKENVEAVEEQLDMMMIEDPLQFEQMLREGELEDARGGDPQH